ncbi:hypothetical protein M9458_025927, partial [Cirrhinus mrigala]
HISSDLPEPRHVSSVCPEPPHLSSDLPEPRHISTSQVLSDLPEPCHIMSASVMTITILSMWAAHYAPEVSSVHKSAPEVSSVTNLVMSASVMAITILSMWPAHYAPEVSSVTKSAPEVSSVHKSAPEVSPVHKSAPESVTNPLLNVSRLATRGRFDILTTLTVIPHPGLRSPSAIVAITCVQSETLFKPHLEPTHCNIVLSASLPAYRNSRLSGLLYCLALRITFAVDRPSPVLRITLSSCCLYTCLPLF